MAQTNVSPESYWRIRAAIEANKGAEVEASFAAYRARLSKTRILDLWAELRRAHPELPEDCTRLRYDDAAQQFVLENI